MGGLPGATLLEEVIISDLRFTDAVKKHVKSSWSTWPIGERMGECFLDNAALMTRESREAVIEHGIDEAFDKLSGVHLMSLKTVWNVCVPSGG